MHTHCCKVIYDGQTVVVLAQHHYRAASLIFAEEGACSAAHYEYGTGVEVFLHMNTCAIARVALDIYLAAAHSVACGVACVAVDNYASAVHSVARGVLSVAVDHHVAAV